MRIIDPNGMDGTLVTGETQEEYLQRNNKESEQFFNSNGPSNMGGGQIGGVETMAPSGYMAPEERQDGKKSSLGLNGSLRSGGSHNADSYSLQNAILGEGNAIQQEAGIIGDVGELRGPALILLGQPLKALKPIGALGSKPGSSIASYTLSKIIPQTFTNTLGKQMGSYFARTLGTNVIGRALGRAVPFVGIGLSTYDYTDYLFNQFPSDLRQLNLTVGQNSCIRQEWDFKKINYEH